MDKKSIKLAIFSNRKDEILKEYIDDETIIIKNKTSICPFNCTVLTFDYVARNYSTVLEMIKDRLVVLYDIDRLYKYDTELTRFFCNIASKETDRKIVCGESMIHKNVYDIFSYYFFLDKKIIGVNHYWCFKANHYEKSRFDETPVKMLDVNYLAKKIKDYTIFEIEPKNELEMAVYETIFAK